VLFCCDAPADISRCTRAQVKNEDHSKDVLEIYQTHINQVFMSIKGAIFVVMSIRKYIVLFRVSFNDLVTDIHIHQMMIIVTLISTY
jgi:hypothetical protein